MAPDEMQGEGQRGGDMLDLIFQAVAGFEVLSDAQWHALTKDVPGVTFFTTDLDPRSFTEDGAGAWVGRAELLLKAPAELRAGHAPQEVSFTLPVKVVLAERDGTLEVAAFDFYAVEMENPPGNLKVLEFGPPKTIGLGPFEGLV